MVSEIKNIRLYKILLEDVDKKISDLEYIENELFIAENEFKALNKKHAGLYFFLLILGFTLLCFIALRMVFVVIPKNFPYYYLAPIPGVIIELVLRNKFNENEKKQNEKALKGQIKKLTAEKEEILQELYALIPILHEAKNKLTNLTDITTDNIQALNYITRNENEYNKVSFEVRYNEFINKINRIDDEKYPELKALKTEILKYDDKTVYRNMVLNSLSREEKAKDEKDNNSVSDTEKK